MSGILISCRDVSVSYDAQNAVEHVTFDIEQGDYITIVGSNGSGKTSLIGAILGLKPIRSGRVEYHGITKSEIGYLPQSTAAQKDFPASTHEVVISGCAARRKLRARYNAEEQALCEESMRRLGISDIAKKTFRDLSGGQQQRVLLARALCASRRMILLDEPLNGLDPVVASELYGIIAGLNRDGVTVVMVSHDILGAVDHSGKILHLDTAMKFFGTAHEYKHSPIGVHFLGKCDECS